MEKQWFDWEDWDQIDMMVFGFHNCVLKTQIGPFYMGMVIPYVEINYEEGKIVLYNIDGEIMFEAKMKASFE